MFYSFLQRGRKSLGGFTLIELLAVVVILGILVAVVVPRIATSSSDAKKSSCEQNVSTINTQAESYYFREGSWPVNDLSDIGADNDYFPDGIPTCPVDGSAYALDGTTHRVTGHDH